MIIWASGLKLFLEKEFITPNSVNLIQHRAALPHYNSSLSKRFLAPVAFHLKIFSSLFWEIFIGCQVSSFNYPPSSSFASASLSMSRDIFLRSVDTLKNARKQLDTEKKMILGHFLGQACMSQFFLDCPVRLLSPRKILDIFKHFHTSNKLLYMVTQLAENGKYCYLTIDIWPQNIDIRPQNIDI